MDRRADARIWPKMRPSRSPAATTGVVLRRAEDVHAMSLANMDGEYCTVVTTDELLSTSPPKRARDAAAEE